DELPTNSANTIRSYPAHISLRDDIVQCQTFGRPVVDVFEQFMEDDVKCGPYHVCDYMCCVAHPELFPKATARRKAWTTPTPQTIPAEWTQPLPCDDEDYYRNPNDCHKFYRCHKVQGKFTKSLYDCNPAYAVFNEQFRPKFIVDSLTPHVDYNLVVYSANQKANSAALTYPSVQLPVLDGPCRAVLMTARELAIEINIKSMDLNNGDQLKPEYLEINPAHMVPTIVETDTGFTIWESRAIMKYLCNRYAPDGQLYPKTPKQRALVDRALDFDVGLAPIIGDVLVI
ncbi:unnamed protein product, partial [Oppiella nova]